MARFYDRKSLRERGKKKNTGRKSTISENGSTRAILQMIWKVERERTEIKYIID